MHSLITLRWNQGGRNVSSATIQRGGKMTKSALARPGTSLGEVRTVKMHGSGWSKLIVPIVLKRARSYFHGARLPCQATTSSGLWSSCVVHKAPRYFWTSSTGSSSSSKAGDRREEVARIGEAVRADRAELGQAEQGAVIFGDIAARLAVGQQGAEADAARDQRDLARRDLDPAHLGEQLEPALLRE